MTTANTQQKLHLGIAEKGKLYSLQGNYKEALRHYREAIRLVQNNKDNDLFFQHYSQCVMEALELSGAYDEVISYCEKFMDFLEEKEESEFVIRHKAHVLEKLAIQYILKGDKEEALPLLKQAQSLLKKGVQPLTDELLNWVQRNYQLSKKQIHEAQKKYNYFIVRKDKVRPELAIEIPDMMKQF
jgi:tetratricopeptide (TPR) repeat protein